MLTLAALWRMKGREGKGDEDDEKEEDEEEEEEKEKRQWKWYSTPVECSGVGTKKKKRDTTESGMVPGVGAANSSAVV